MKKFKVACIIPGDIRRGTDVIVNYMCNIFDIVILSTWINEELPKNIENDNLYILLNTKTESKGKNNRNYLRYAVEKSFEKLEELKVDYVLKWRTDMLPLGLNVKKLLDYSNYDIEDKEFSRIVTSGFRTITLKNDWYSSIPDLFSFGSLSAMRLLWCYDNFNYSKEMNVPNTMLKEDSIINVDKYYNETELYALYKDNLQKKFNKKLTHPEIVLKFMYIIEHKNLKIIWFSNSKGFRVINPARGHSWWTEKVWKEKMYEVVDYSYNNGSILNNIKKRLGFILDQCNKLEQHIRFKIFLRMK